MNNKVILGSLAMDLKRVALGYYKGSYKTADVFLNEAIKRCDEIDQTQVKPYIIKILNQIKDLDGADKQKTAEDALMFSTIIQNSALKL